MRVAFFKYVVVIMLVVLSGAVLMEVSQRVQRAEREISRLDRKIERERERVRILDAEWAYLNDPARLEAMARAGLEMSSPEAGALISNTGAIPDIDVFVEGASPMTRDTSSKKTDP